MAGFTAKGDIRLSNGWVVSKDFGHLAHGYVTTSHASQGKSVDHVILGQSAESLPASSQQQFYVSVSRGKSRVTIHTDDKRALLEAVTRTDDRQTATELLADPRDRVRIIETDRIARSTPTAPARAVITSAPRTGGGP